METSTENSKQSVSSKEVKSSIVGCAHYKRKSKFVTPCCNKVYTCRFCHDENEDHTVNRKEVTELVCTNCNIRQPVQAECQYCGIRFGKYTCLECNLFDDEDKNQYHCAGCGICRIGGVDRFFHCPKCNMCLPIQLKNGHRCVENVSRANCPVCLEDIHTSRIPCHIPDCGHLLHKPCFDQLLNSGHYACPICQTSLLDMTQLWKYLDREVEMTPMPVEYRNYTVEILCKDCHKESVVKFHVVGLKCLQCGSYNTCRIKGSGRFANNSPLAEAASLPNNDNEEEDEFVDETEPPTSLSREQLAEVILTRNPNITREALEEMFQRDFDDSDSEERRRNDRTEEELLNLVQENSSNTNGATTSTTAESSTRVNPRSDAKNNLNGQRENST